MTLDPSRYSLVHIDADENEGENNSESNIHLLMLFIYLRHLEKSLAFLTSVLLSAIPTIPRTVPDIYQTFHKCWWTKGSIIKIL